MEFNRKVALQAGLYVGSGLCALKAGLTFHAQKREQKETLLQRKLNQSLLKVGAQLPTVVLHYSEVALWALASLTCLGAAALIDTSSSKIEEKPAETPEPSFTTFSISEYWEALVDKLSELDETYFKGYGKSILDWTQVNPGKTLAFGATTVSLGLGALSFYNPCSRKNKPGATKGGPANSLGVNAGGALVAAASAVTATSTQGQGGAPSSVAVGPSESSLSSSSSSSAKPGESLNAQTSGQSQGGGQAKKPSVSQEGTLSLQNGQAGAREVIHEENGVESEGGSDSDSESSTVADFSPRVDGATSHSSGEEGGHADNNSYRVQTGSPSKMCKRDADGNFVRWTHQGGSPDSVSRNEASSGAMDPLENLNGVLKGLSSKNLFALESADLPLGALTVRWEGQKDYIYVTKEDGSTQLFSEFLNEFTNIEGDNKASLLIWASNRSTIRKIKEANAKRAIQQELAAAEDADAEYRKTSLVANADDTLYSLLLEWGGATRHPYPFVESVTNESITEALESVSVENGVYWVLLEDGRKVYLTDLLKEMNLNDAQQGLIVQKLNQHKPIPAPSSQRELSAEEQRAAAALASLAVAVGPGRVLEGSFDDSEYSSGMPSLEMWDEDSHSQAPSDTTLAKATSQEEFSATSSHGPVIHEIRSGNGTFYVRLVDDQFQVGMRPEDLLNSKGGSRQYSRRAVLELLNRYKKRSSQGGNSRAPLSLKDSPVSPVEQRDRAPFPAFNESSTQVSRALAFDLNRLPQAWNEYFQNYIEVTDQLGVQEPVLTQEMKGQIRVDGRGKIFLPCETSGSKGLVSVDEIIGTRLSVDELNKLNRFLYFQNRVLELSDEEFLREVSRVAHEGDSFDPNASFDNTLDRMAAETSWTGDTSSEEVSAKLSKAQEEGVDPFSGLAGGDLNWTNSEESAQEEMSSYASDASLSAYFREQAVEQEDVGPLGAHSPGVSPVKGAAEEGEAKKE